MPRLVQMPIGLKVTSRAPLTGPRTASGNVTESLTGFAQTVASPFGLWRWQFTLTAMHKDMARRYRGFVTALHGGANAFRVTMGDPDMMSWRDSGVNINENDPRIRRGVPFSNGAFWSNGTGWQISRPTVQIAAAAARYDSIVSLANEYWRGNLNVGDQIGFAPFYFGLHVVTEVFGDGTFRIWPPLRGALTTANWATLYPVMVMRLESESSATIARGVSTMEAPTIVMTEVEDADVRLFYDG